MCGIVIEEIKSEFNRLDWFYEGELTRIYEGELTFLFLLLLAHDKRKRKRCYAQRVVKKGAIYWREIAFNFNSKWLDFTSTWQEKMQAVFCSACCQKSAGLERLDLIDFSVILCIEKEGKKCQKKVMIWESQKVEMWKHI